MSDSLQATGDPVGITERGLLSDPSDRTSEDIERTLAVNLHYGEAIGDPSLDASATKEFLAARARYVLAVEQVQQEKWTGPSATDAPCDIHDPIERAAYVNALHERDEAKKAFHDAAVDY